jgi:hypothetical protein
LADEEILVVELDSNGNQQIRQSSRNEHMETIEQNDQNEKKLGKSVEAHKSTILKQQGNETGPELNAHPTKHKKIVFV